MIARILKSGNYQNAKSPRISIRAGIYERFNASWPPEPDKKVPSGPHQGVFRHAERLMDQAVRRKTGVLDRIPDWDTIFR